jgi:hypothetical protein
MLVGRSTECANDGATAADGETQDTGAGSAQNPARRADSRIDGESDIR